MVMDGQKKQEESNKDVIRVESTIALDYICECGETLGGDDAELTPVNGFKQEIAAVETTCPKCQKKVCHKKIVIAEI